MIPEPPLADEAGDPDERDDDAPKRRQIIAGAAAVFSEAGYEGASMSRIALRAGVSKGTLYNYFTSKSDLFCAYVERETRRKIAWILESADEERDIGEALRQIAERLTRTLLSPSAQTMYRILVAEAPKFPDLARIYYEAGQGRGSAEMARWLERQSADGRLRIDDPQLAAEQFVSLCRTRFWMRRCLQLLPCVSDDEIDFVVGRNVAMFLGAYGAVSCGEKAGDHSIADHR